MSASIKELIKQIVREEFTEVYGVPCTVIDGSIDLGAGTCDCRPINGDADFIGVRLQAHPGNSLLIIPAEGSKVIVQPINNVTGYIALFSQVDSIQMLDGSLGGLTKTQELKTQLDKSNDVLNTIKTVLDNWTPVPNDGGAALKTAYMTAIATKVVGDFSDIENEAITHGNV